MKTCIRCKIPKEDKQFRVENKRTGRRRSYCFDCQREYGRQHYRDNSDVYKIQARSNSAKYRLSNKLKLLEYLKDKKCLDCPENDPRVLDFDHQHPKHKIKSISDMLNESYCWQSILKEIAKCDIRCSNCHRKRTCQQFPNYKTKP